MKQRSLVPEKMDDPGLDTDLHLQALAGLKRINFFSRTPARIASTLHSIALRKGLQEISIVDFGSGGGEVAIGIANYFHRKGFPATVTGWDRSPIAIQAATTNIPTHLKGQVSFEPVDLESPSIQPLSFDFAICSLFLHHFEASHAIDMLRRMKNVARAGILVDDLRRSQTGLILAYLACYGLSRSPIVHFDGPQSVRAAFSIEEAKEMAREAELHGSTITRQWPQRFQLVWVRNA